jgi:chromosome segregation ATPase
MDETLGGGGSTRLSNTELVSEDDDGVLGQLSVSVTHRRTADLRGSASAASAASSSIYGSTSTKRSGRHSVAAGGNPMTLREQEQNVDALQKENFNLQLENHFLKERLASMAPDHIEAALKENVKLKIEILNLSKELKKAKKLLSQQDRDLNAAARERGNHSLDSRQLEAMYRDEKDRVATLAVDLDDKTTRIQQLEEELDAATGKLQDQEIELFNLNEELDKVKGLGESVSISKGREARLVQKLEEENDELKQEAREFEDRNNDLRDQLASAQIEIDQLNNEMDAKVDAHEREIQQVESEWREEVIEARAQVEEFKGTVQERDNIVVELEEELGAMRDRNEELLQREELIADQLEEVQKKFDNDNATRETDLQDANREIQDVSRQ